MKKTVKSLIFVMIFFAAVATTFAIYRKASSGTGSLDTATWSISRSTSQQGDSIDLIPGTTTDTYDLTVTSNSEVDVYYTIIVDNLPEGVEVKLDNGSFVTPTNHKATINGGVINYNDSVKTKSHTLTFRANSSTQLVTENELDIDVLFKQGL